MKTMLVFICLIFLAGCATLQQPETAVSQPELLEQTSLPPIEGTIFNNSLRLVIRMLIDEEGNVIKAKFINGSGNEEWDAVALESIAKWRFSPAKLNNKPIKIWVNQIALVKIQEPVFWAVSEILCGSYEEARSVYDSLIEGKDFSEMASRYSVSATKAIKGYLGKVDINMYSQPIREQIMKLKDNEFTKPIKYGSKFIIFKKHPMMSNLSVIPAYGGI
jgi:TonB family protein